MTQFYALLIGVLDMEVYIKLPDGLDYEKFSNLLSKGIEDLKLEQQKLNDEKLYKNKTVTDILHDLKNGSTPEYIDNIMKWNYEYKNNRVIKLIINFHAHYFKKDENLNIIFQMKSSRIILGLLLHIPVRILIALKDEGSPQDEWIIDELAYYRDNGNIRIDNICRNIRTYYDSAIIDYLRLNHNDVLHKYDKMLQYDDLAIKMTEMKELLKI